jgi:hypothetical protein
MEEIAVPSDDAFCRRKSQTATNRSSVASSDPKSLDLEIFLKVQLYLFVIFCQKKKQHSNLD